MIDLHSHVLPGLDDGAADLDEAVAMGRAAAEDGIRVLAATPHVRDAVAGALGDEPLAHWLTVGVPGAILGNEPLPPRPPAARPRRRHLPR